MYNTSAVAPTFVGCAVEAGATDQIAHFPTNSIDAEFATPSDLSAADVRVVGYAFVKKPDGSRNIVARIINGGNAAITVTALVWQFEASVTNWDGQF